LLVRAVVPTLGLPSIHLIGIGPSGGTAKKSRTSPDGSPGTRVAGGGADCRTEASPDGRPDDGPDGCILVRRRARRPADLLRRPLSADRVIRLELLEGFSGGRQDHHARTGRIRRASAQDERHQTGEETSFMEHLATSYRPGKAGEGATFSQALGHCLTYG
jgi:hypothetical protein